MATNEEVLNPMSLILPTKPGSRGPTGNIFVSGGKLLLVSGAVLAEITKTLV